MMITCSAHKAEYSQAKPVMSNDETGKRRHQQILEAHSLQAHQQDIWLTQRQWLWIIQFETGMFLLIFICVLLTFDVQLMC